MSRHNLYIDTWVVPHTQPTYTKSELCPVFPAAHDVYRKKLLRWEKDVDQPSLDISVGDQQ